MKFEEEHHYRELCITIVYIFFHQDSSPVNSTAFLLMHIGNIVSSLIFNSLRQVKVNCFVKLVRYHVISNKTLKNYYLLTFKIRVAY